MIENTGPTQTNQAIVKRPTSGSTANLLELQDENGNVLGYFAPNGNFFLSPAGSTQSVPKKFGFSPNFTSGQAARLFFGDEGAGGMQIAFDSRMQIYSFNGMTFQGGRDTGEPAFIPFVAGSVAHNFLGTNPARRIIDVTAPSGQTAELQQWTRSGVTGTMGVNQDVNLRFRDDSVQTTATSRAFLSADVANGNATANTLANITGLSFPVVAGRRYNFVFTIMYDAAATTTGARFSVNGPAFTRLGFTVTVPTVGAGSASAAQTLQTSVHNAYDAGPAVGAFSPFTTGNIAQIAGTVVPSASGTFIARFASEVASSAITAKAGSNVEYAEV